MIALMFLCLAVSLSLGEAALGFQHANNEDLGARNVQNRLVERTDQNAVRQSDDPQTQADCVSMAEFTKHVKSSEESIAALTAMVDKSNKHVDDIDGEFKTNKATVTQELNSLKGRSSTLESNYKSHTVKQCLSGSMDNLQHGSRTISFSPAFPSIPAFTFGMDAFDAGNKAVRYNIVLKTLTTSSATLQISTWESSYIAWSRVRWIACI